MFIFYVCSNLLVIVDQVGLDFARGGLKNTQKIADLCGDCLVVIGTWYIEPNNKLRIWGEETMGRSRYFVFGEPYNEDEVVEFLRLYQSSARGVNEQILDELLASYGAYKENQSREEEEMKGGDEDPSISLWIRFKEVTGFVPLFCWRVIIDRRNRKTLEERLEEYHEDLIDSVSSYTSSFYYALSKEPAGPLLQANYKEFCKIARDNYLIQNEENVDGGSSSMNDLSVYGEERMSWNLRYVNCYYDNEENVLHTPIALSKTVADGFLQVLSILNDYFFLKRHWRE